MPFSTPARGLVDIHSHLVPAVDDGTRSIEESLLALRELAGQGVTRLVTTPHLLLPQLTGDGEITGILDGHRVAFDALMAAIPADSGRYPEITLGQEILAPDADSARRALGHPSIGLGGTDFWLVEFGFDLPSTHLDVIRTVQDGGREIIIAHPERYRYDWPEQGLDLIRTWRAMGAWLQVNAGSLAGHYRSSSPFSRRLAWAALGEGLVHIIATDHHGPRRQGVSLREAMDALEGRGAALEGDRLLRENPDRVLMNQLPEPVAPVPAREVAAE